MTRLINLTIGFMVVVYGPPYFVPISYLCFGAPAQEEWTLPLQARFDFTTINKENKPKHHFHQFCIYREFLNRHTFHGFYILLTNLFCGSIFYFLFLTCSLGFYISLCLYTQAFVEDFRNVMSSFDRGTLGKRQTYPIISEAVQVHSEMLKLLKFNQISLYSFV